jgi:hypothetical protein
MRILPRVIAFVVALFMLVFGIWALVDWQSFQHQIATFPPDNPHLIHDIGAFQAGIGATLLFALFRGRDALGVVLMGTSVGTVLHAVAHFIDQDRGGRSTDPVAITLIAVATLVATAIHVSQRQR